MNMVCCFTGPCRGRWGGGELSFWGHCDTCRTVAVNCAFFLMWEGNTCSSTDLKCSSHSQLIPMRIIIHRRAQQQQKEQKKHLEDDLGEEQVNVLADNALHAQQAAWYVYKVWVLIDPIGSQCSGPNVASQPRPDGVRCI